MEEKKNLTFEEEKIVAGGAGKGGYCPFAVDRTCHVELIGRFDDENEDCRECGYRYF